MHFFVIFQTVDWFVYNRMSKDKEEIFFLSFIDFFLDFWQMVKPHIFWGGCNISNDWLILQTTILTSHFQEWVFFFFFPHIRTITMVFSLLLCFLYLSKLLNFWKYSLFEIFIYPLNLIEIFWCLWRICSSGIDDLEKRLAALRG